MENSIKLSGQKAFHKLGIDAGMFEDSFVEASFQKRLSENSLTSIDDYIQFALNNKDELQVLKGLLQNSYSEFFRNPLTFSVLEKIVFPPLIADKRSKGKEIRIWSAACAAGQEPYSLAILLEENENMKKDAVRYRIFATDKSKSQIEHAKLGCYTSFSLDQVSLKRISSWFDSENRRSGNDNYCIKNELKRNIEFSVFDLLEEHSTVPPSSIFGNFDLVFCANLLFYYKPAYREIILNKITKSLATNGLIVAGETERELLKQQGFTEIFYQSGIFRR